MENKDIKNLLEKITLEQKCALLSGGETFKTRPFEQYGISKMELSDGPNGVRKQAGAADHLGLNPSVPATCLPTAVSMANTWNPELCEKAGELLGEETAANEVSVILGPGLNIQRNPLCGRNFEYFSEDPYLAGKMAAGYIRGIQSKGVSACPKHFAVNSQETRRMATDSVIDERTLREIYLTGFEIAVKEGKPETIMTSYNMINGTYANEDEHLLKDILKDEWRYEGMVVTDWGGSNDHALGVKAGSTLEMPAPGLDSVRELVKAVNTNKISETDVDKRCEELLSLIFKTREVLDNSSREFDKEAHHNKAKELAEETIVLLKNEEDILPLSNDKKIALIGDFADTSRYQGAGSSMVNSTKVDDLKTKLSETDLNIIGYEQGFERLGGKNDELKTKAGLLAKEADIILLCLGQDEVQESEGLDRTKMTISGNQVELLAYLYGINKNIVVCLSGGSPVETDWRKYTKGFIWNALGGQAGAGALADVLSGKVNPSGRLSETWPESYEDVPSGNYFANDGRNVEYRDGMYVGYRYYESADVKPAFEFGYGLSYTTFEITEVKAGKDKVLVTITNTGDREGAEVIQLYVSKEDSILPEHFRQLKGFKKVYLNAKETKTVEIPFDEYTFRYWNVKTNNWETEGGTYQISVCTGKKTDVVTVSVETAGSNAVDPYTGKDLSSYRKGDITDLSDSEFEELLGHSVPANKTVIDRNITFGELKHARSPVFIIVSLVMTAMKNSSLKKGQPNLNVLFIYNMPLRALAKMTSGMVSMGMVDGIVMEVKGFWLIGLIRVIYEFIKNLILNASMEKRLKA